MRMCCNLRFFGGILRLVNEIHNSKNRTQLLKRIPYRKKNSHLVGETKVRIIFSGGARRDRTADLYNAIVALSQLSYDPIELSDLFAVKHYSFRVGKRGDELTVGVT